MRAFLLEDFYDNGHDFLYSGYLFISTRLIYKMYRDLDHDLISTQVTGGACKQRKPRLPFKKKLPFIHFVNNNNNNI